MLKPVSTSSSSSLESQHVLLSSLRLYNSPAWYQTCFHGKVKNVKIIVSFLYISRFNLTFTKNTRFPDRYLIDFHDILNKKTIDARSNERPQTGCFSEPKYWKFKNDQIFSSTKKSSHIHMDRVLLFF